MNELPYLRALLNEGSVHPNYKTTTKIDLEMRDGTVISAGTEVFIDFNTESEQEFYILSSRRRISVDVTLGHRFLHGFQKPPRLPQLWREIRDHAGKCSTPLGNMVDVNGHGSFGEPSWQRIFSRVDEK